MDRVNQVYYCNDNGPKCPFNSHGQCVTWQDCPYKGTNKLTLHETWYKQMEDKK